MERSASCRAMRRIGRLCAPLPEHGGALLALRGLERYGLVRGSGSSPDASYRYSAMLTFRPIEPVFLRAQLNHNDFADEDGRDRGMDFMLQLNVALGAHGAHRF